MAFGLFAYKRNLKVLKKLYDENIVLQNLPEKIDFKEAKTVEEAVKFTKDVLKVKDVDEGFTLDALNFVNKGLTEVSNANKGKVFMPRKIWFEEMAAKEEHFIAYVNSDIKSPYFGHLSINKKYFNDEVMSKKLNELLGIDVHKSKSNINTSKPTEVKSNINTPKPKTLDIRLCYEPKVYDLLNKYHESADSLNILEKRELYFNLVKGVEFFESKFYLSPLSLLSYNLETFNNIGIKVDVDAFKKLSTKEQSKKLKDLFLQLQEKTGNKQLNIEVPYESPRSAIWHEMGHLQDFAKNLKELDLRDKDIFSSSATINSVGERWVKIDQKLLQKLSLKQKKKAEKLYPNMYKFLSDQNIQQTAGKVSPYAQTSIGEFIAEVYAKMVNGDKLPNDVFELYKKYNGPMLPGLA